MPDACDDGFCCEPKEVLTGEELRILAELRAVKAEYRRLRAEPLAGGPELDELRRRWQTLASELKRENRAKWVKLGYAPPD